MNFILSLLDSLKWADLGVTVYSFEYLLDSHIFRLIPTWSFRKAKVEIRHQAEEFRKSSLGKEEKTKRVERKTKQAIELILSSFTKEETENSL